MLRMLAKTMRIVKTVEAVSDAVNDVSHSNEGGGGKYCKCIQVIIDADASGTRANLAKSDIVTENGGTL